MIEPQKETSYLLMADDISTEEYFSCKIDSLRA